MIELNVEKILSQPNMDAKGEEIYRQYEEQIKNETVGEITTREEILIGAICSLTLQQLNIMEYVDCITSALNHIGHSTRSNVQVINFADWYDTRDMTDDQRKEWLVQKNEQWRKRQKRIITRDNLQ